MSLPSRSVVSRKVEGDRDGTDDLRALARTPRKLASLRRHFVALVELIVVFAVAFGSMIVFADILRHFYPTHRFDEFAAVHRPVVLGILVGFSALWTLAPRPMATSVHLGRRNRSRAHRAAGRHARITV